MIIMISSWLVSKQFLPFKINIQGFASWLSPSMIVLEEHVLELCGLLESWSHLLHVWRNIASLCDQAWSNLSDVHVNK